MKVSITAGNLGQGLQVVSRAVSSRTTLPILNNVLLQTDQSGLNLTATNLEIGIRQTVPAEVQEEGGITVPARLLTDFVSGLPDEPIDMTLDKKTQSLAVKSRRFNATIRGIDPADFPPVPSGVEGRKVSVDPAELKEAIEQTVIAASSDEGRPVLTGVYVQLNGGKATFAATDGHRLAVKTLPVTAEPGETDTIVIPARALSELSRILKGGEAGIEVTVGAQKNQVFFKAHDVELMSRLIEGNYPNYQQVIPKESTTTITAKTQDLLFTTKMVSLFSKDAANVIKFKTEGGQLTVTANTSEVGQNVSTVDAKIEGNDLQVAFNSKYLLDVLGIIGSDEVQLGFTGPLNPGLIRPVGKDNYLYIIMPVRVAM
ncbi:MAG TPA: DNA polymerase III subunit beta [Candidatus Dormibacteraeota bacterium]|jgi:DNA polymerase-3 subunit beta|nr:DNA polymerase III subunit beta [Candidatus Dormibacteraeota bacterium]